MSTPGDRRAAWMLAGIAFNSVASLTAIGLWIASPGRDCPAQCPPAPTGPLAPPPSNPAPRADRPPPLPPALSPRPRPRDPPEPAQDTIAEEATPPANPIALSKNSTGLASAALIDLTTRLNLNPQVVADQLGDANGDLPKPYAERLQRGFSAGGSLARRLGLDEARGQSLVALFTFHVLSVLREEKAAAPREVDPARIEELEAALLKDIRTSIGDDVAEEAKRALPDL